MQQSIYKFGKIKNKIRNKKAWLRVVEAAAAVLILLGFIFVTIAKAPSETSLQETVQNLVLNIEQNSAIRDKILDGTPLKKEDLTSLIPTNMDFDFSLCKYITAETFSCNSEIQASLPKKEIFADSILITRKEATKRFTLYIWEK